MGNSPPNLRTTIQGCLRNGQRLVEGGELLRDFDRHPTAFAVAMLAQEEFAKAFMLVLMNEGVVPWTPEMRRSLHSHECKHLVGVLVEWLGPPWEEQERRLKACIGGNPPKPAIPHDVAVAINILRHEKIERMRTGYSWPDPEDSGPSRKIAEGLRDRAKHRALYVGVTQTGWPESLPTRVTREEATAEVERAKQYAEFAEAAFGNRVLSFDEYRVFKDVVRAVFADLSPRPEKAQ
jgi:AbiV family abortive infection protein